MIAKQITVDMVKVAPSHTYTLRGPTKTAIAHVFQHTGSSGYSSAAIVVVQDDVPIMTLSMNWHTHEAELAGKPTEPMMLWIAECIDGLSAHVQAQSIE